MSISHPMSTHPRCTAHSKQKGIQCGRTAIPGGNVCRYHGGAAPQVMAKAEERLAALIHPAITRLAQLIAQEEFPSVAIAAVKDALDRNGALGKAKETKAVEVSGKLTLEDLVAASLLP